MIIIQRVGTLSQFFNSHQGPSASGKTSWVMKLLKERERLFNPVPTRYYWCYQRYFKEAHEVLKKDVPNIEFFDNFDYEYMISRIEDEPEENHCLILDDSLQSPESLDLIFTR